MLEAIEVMSRPAAACQHPAEKRPAAGEDQLPAGGGDEDSHTNTA